MNKTVDIRGVVREKYSEIVEGNRTGSGCCGGGCGCGSGGGCGCGSGGGEGSETALASLGYSSDQEKAIPDGADLGLGCGNPLAHASAKPGETVLDLGSGAGIDAFLAAREVGPTGRVIGIDMTAAMVTRARENAAKGGYENVEFRLGEIENLPVADAAADVVISNCVINLSPDKPRVFREAWRALRPGGRMIVSDLVITRPLPESVRESVEAYVGCVAGASMKEEYLQFIGDAGFNGVEIVEERTYGVGAGLLPGAATEAGVWDAVRSVKVRATKPRA